MPGNIPDPIQQQIDRLAPMLKEAQEFPSQARVLFEASAPHYMPTEGLAILGSHLISRIVKTVR